MGYEIAVLVYISAYLLGLVWTVCTYFQDEKKIEKMEPKGFYKVFYDCMNFLLEVFNDGGLMVVFFVLFLLIPLHSFLALYFLCSSVIRIFIIKPIRVLVITLR